MDKLKEIILSLYEEMTDLSHIVLIAPKADRKSSHQIEKILSGLELKFIKTQKSDDELMYSVPDLDTSNVADLRKVSWRSNISMIE